jgi:hypothetical protein
MSQSVVAGGVVVGVVRGWLLIRPMVLHHVVGRRSLVVGSTTLRALPANG